MIKSFNANKARLRRHQRLRRHLAGSEERPRLNVFRSGSHIYAQVIDDRTGQTLVSASSLEEALRNFKPAPQERSAAQAAAPQEEAEQVEQAAEEAPSKKGARAKAQPQPAKGAKGGQPQRGPVSQVKTVLPSAQKGAKKTPAEALAAISGNRKVALAREVGRLVAQRAKEKGVSKVVFDRGGYTYHGRVAALAEGAREAGLDF